MLETNHGRYGITRKPVNLAWLFRVISSLPWSILFEERRQASYMFDSLHWLDHLVVLGYLAVSIGL
ncbi:MAG: hypothetical protein ACI93T_004791, partial [Porticoccaceae bacterium]